jgi:hypothetical protein
MSKFVGLDAYDNDEKRESESGFEIELADGISITVLRAGGSNKKFARVYGRITGPFQRRIQNKTLDDKIADRLMHEIYAEAIVVDWKGIRVHGHDEDMPCTKENVMDLFACQPDIFDIVRDVSGDMANFRVQEIEDTVEPLGNS